jgi:hypothetical protein
MNDGATRGFLQFQDVRAFLDSVLEGDIHTKRIEPLANATLGVMTGASLGVAIIGRSLAQARGLLTTHAVQQVDRLLSHPRLEAWDVFATWVPQAVGARQDIVVAMDWTDDDADGQATLVLRRVTRHGRTPPLVWLSVFKDELKDAGLRRLAAVLPDGGRVTLLAASPTPRCSASWTTSALATSSGSRPPPRSAPPTAPPGRRPGGSARAAGRASCATPRSPRRAARSARWWACTPKP